MQKLDHSPKSHSRPGSIGLALGGGGAKGLAHIGVIKALEEAGVEIDYIAGTSMGALVGAWYALTKDIYALEDIFLKLRSRDFLHLVSVFGKGRAMFRDDAVRKVLARHFGDATFASLRIPFHAIATDIANGDTVVLSKGKIVDAVRASISLPIIFNPTEVSGRFLMDGGLSDPVPADIVREMGAEIVLAVDVSSQWVSFADEAATSRNMYSVISNALSIIEFQIAKEILKKADVVLRPPVLSYDWTAFGRASEIMRVGADEARLALPQIRKLAGYAEPEKSPLETFLDFLKGE